MVVKPGSSFVLAIGSSFSLASSNSRNVSNSCSMLELLLMGVAAGSPNRPWSPDPGLSLTPPPPPSSSSVIRTGMGNFTCSTRELLLPWVTEKGGGGGGGRLLLDWGLGIPFIGTWGDNLAPTGSGGLRGTTFLTGSGTPGDLAFSSSAGWEGATLRTDSMGDLGLSPSIP